MSQINGEKCYPYENWVVSESWCLIEKERMPFDGHDKALREKEFLSKPIALWEPSLSWLDSENTLENSRFEIQDYVSSDFVYFSLIYCESLNTLSNSYTLHICKAMYMERQLDSIHSTFSSMRSSYNCILLCEVNPQNSWSCRSTQSLNLSLAWMHLDFTLKFASLPLVMHCCLDSFHIQSNCIQEYILVQLRSNHSRVLGILTFCSCI